MNIESRVKRSNLVRSLNGLFLNAIPKVSAIWMLVQLSDHLNSIHLVTGRVHVCYLNGSVIWKSGIQIPVVFPKWFFSSICCLEISKDGHLKGQNQMNDLHRYLIEGDTTLDICDFITTIFFHVGIIQGESFNFWCIRPSMSEYRNYFISGVQIHTITSIWSSCFLKIQIFSIFTLYLFCKPRLVDIHAKGSGFVSKSRFKDCYFWKTVYSGVDDQQNSNFKWVDANSRCNYFVAASYRHLCSLPLQNYFAEKNIAVSEFELRTSEAPDMDANPIPGCSPIYQ